eukprot:48636-Alexandrium_andersonii.AAC.1
MTESYWSLQAANAEMPQMNASRTSGGSQDKAQLPLGGVRGESHGKTRKPRVIASPRREPHVSARREPQVS